MLKKVWASFKAAVTSPEAVKQERSLAALVVFRLALAVGASAGLAEFVSKLVHG
jgi:hypothetical protein